MGWGHATGIFLLGMRIDINKLATGFIVLQWRQNELLKSLPFKVLSCRNKFRRQILREIGLVDETQCQDDFACCVSYFGCRVFVATLNSCDPHKTPNTAL